MDANALDTTCDGLFLIVDTAQHDGWSVDEAEVKAHIRECAACFERNGEYI